MAVFIALLRAVNVGGTGKLAMKELCALCEELGFARARTCIQSGNVVFESRLKKEEIASRLESALARKLGRRVDVVVRTAAEMQAVLESNPFPDAPPAKVAVLFGQAVPPKSLADVVAPGREEIRLGRREIYVHYPDGMGRSRLKLPTVGPVTARNMQTVARLVAMALPQS